MLKTSLTGIALTTAVLAAAVISTCAAIATPAFALSPDEKAEIKQMHWTPAANVHLTTSKSTIVSLSGFQVVQGTEARRFREIADAIGDPEIEVDAINFDTGSEIVFSWYPEGFVRSDDWADVNADSFLQQMKEKDAGANRIRASKGLLTLSTLGWLEKPHFNEDTHTVSWRIDAVDSSGHKVVNAVALKLGRYGFERIVWIADPADVGDKNDLLLAVNNHRYDDRARYADYVAGTDHAAAYGIAGLVAGALGVKVLKVAGAGAALIALKKLGALLLLPFFFAWRKIVGLFKARTALNVTIKQCATCGKPIEREALTCRYCHATA